jgi:uncharacterized protein (DUF1499 family)
MLPDISTSGGRVMQGSRAATTSMGFGIAALAAFALGPALALLDWTSAFVAFRIFGLGLLLGLVALLLGAVGLWQTRAAAGAGGRRRAVIGILCGLPPLVIAAAAVGSSGDVPLINDITTDTQDPPRFTAAATDDANSGRDLAYPGEEFAAQQRSGYPDLSPIRVVGSPNAVFDRSVAAAEQLGWKITVQDGAAGRFEATASSRLFGFVDDIVVRVRRNGADSIVDVRSKSRDGRGDMGANAARIRAFRDALGD